MPDPHESKQPQTRPRDDVAAQPAPPTELALTAAELAAAEAIVTEMRRNNVPDFAALHDRRDANQVLQRCMADEGLDVLSDLAAANRITATADLVASPEVATHEDDGESIHCGDCGRRMVYDNRSDEYRHLVNPSRGCFLIPPESWSAASLALDLAAHPQVDAEGSPSSEHPGIGL